MLQGLPYPELWAKVDGQGATHPLICHMVDVAQVAMTIWETVLPQGYKELVRSSLGMTDHESAGRLVAFWAGLHDLGKATPAFALLKSEVAAIPVRSLLPCPARIDPVPHGVLTAHLLLPLLEELGYQPRLARDCAQLLGGHHGTMPSGEQASEDRVPKTAIGCLRWDTARRELYQALSKVVPPPAVGAGRLLPAAAMAIAGLVSVADWIGSDEDLFPYASQHHNEAGHHHNQNKEFPSIWNDPYSYARLAAQRATKALQTLGWVPPRPEGSPRSFGDLFPAIKAPPRPLQQAAIDLAPALAGPCIALIEAPMGEGKTEAAMYLVDSLAGRSGNQGCYFALPTQATSNQMFGRVVEFLQQRFLDQDVNLQLLHGHASLLAEFQVLKQRAGWLCSPTRIYDDEPPGHTGQVMAAEWFTYRKRGLLAPFGVGTVDQALMAVLRTRHVFVRLFGLASKPVIIDEVHAYDTYMSALLERLLEWLGALGSPVVLLSATLPKERGEALIAAYLRGAQTTGQMAAPAGPVKITQSYPRITWALANREAAGPQTGRSLEGGCQHIATSQQMSRTLYLQAIDGELPAEGQSYPLGERLQEALAGGGCAAVICNTVSQAQEVYRRLKPYFPGLATDGQPELDLLHARFLFQDRDEREKRCLARFGKPPASSPAEGPTTTRPHRAVLVATQIIEQSLDLDFDLMVSDLAPADLVLQRAGRLWRHQRSRPASMPYPELWLCMPRVSSEGMPQFPAGHEKVYDAHLLLRSWLALQGRRQLRIPQDVEELVENVYSSQSACPSDACAALRQRWERTWQEQQKDRQAERVEAQTRWLRPPGFSGPLWKLAEDPKEEDAPDFHQAHQALTRLAEPSVSIVCLYGNPERPCLDQALHEEVDLKAVPSPATAVELLQRSVSVSDRRVVRQLLEQAVPAGWRRSALLRHHRLVTLDCSNRAPLGRYTLHLDPEVGVIISEP